ncbi:hypothetical protein SLH49_11585 [Cognatiyoonia sp. IB215446]|uniref:hypothetical protein n=1 Tax=Cognatiyoonia sp. IB215446 TaxID=3097355 RepID=UPI002A135853|nr:hypothetical protein [Cognatiyoonia sp. IB215446]MDX8348626.1 hypothetical protein [Cognatiyoonia sp. IB215446]
MRQPKQPSYHTLGALDGAIRNEIDVAFPSHLQLVGQQTDQWPNKNTPEYEVMIRQIKAGLAFYALEGFLWPQDKDSPPISVWVGNSWRKSTQHLHKLGDNDLPSLEDVLWTPRKPDVQPVAMRTYDEAMTYRRAGALLDRRFLPLLTRKWRIRETALERAKVTSEFQRRFRFKELFYHGDYPSKIAEGMAAEFRYVLGSGPHEPHVPPSTAYEKAFHRQLRLLREAWDQNSDGTGTPPREWVRNRLSHPEYQDYPIENGYADRYRRAFIEAP